MHVKHTHFLHMATALVLMCLVLSGVKTYEVWSQIEYLWSSRENPFAVSTLSELGAHGLRYMLLYPLLVFCEAFGLDHNMVFSMLVPVMTYVVMRNVWAVLGALSDGRSQTVIAALFIAGLFFALFFSMNGRISLAFLGYSIIFRILAIYHYTQNHLSVSQVGLVILAVLFCSVSSGTLMSAFLLVFLSVGVLFLSVYKKLRARKSAKYILVLVFASLYLFGRFIIIGINKNIAFYGGGISGFIEMLGHGFGKVFLPLFEIFPPVILLVAALVGMGFGLYVIDRFRYSYLLLQTLCALSIGVFGYSALSLISMPATVCLILCFFKRKRVLEQPEESLTGYFASRPLLRSETEF